MKTELKKELLACAFGITIGALAVSLFNQSHIGHTHEHDDDSHGITQLDEFHIHTDFVIKVRDEILDLSAPEMMTTSKQQLHKSVHLHDENGKVVHMHAPDITFAEFLDSLSIELSNDCLVTSDDNEFCNSDTEKLTLLVNGEVYEGELISYIPQDLDKVLIYYGDESESAIISDFGNVTDDSCFYSGLCPERGIAPSENCGLTCEL